MSVVPANCLSGILLATRACRSSHSSRKNWVGRLVSQLTDSTQLGGREGTWGERGSEGKEEGGGGRQRGGRGGITISSLQSRMQFAINMAEPKALQRRSSPQRLNFLLAGALGSARDGPRRQHAEGLDAGLEAGVILVEDGNLDVDQEAQARAERDERAIA